MKKVSNSINDFVTFREKRLDKVASLLYNIRTGKGSLHRKFSMYKNSITVPPTEFTSNTGVTEEGLSSLQSIYPALREVHEKYFPGETPPVIAGGMIRDILLGFPFRDIDVFYPKEGDLDDENVYYTGLLTQDFPDKFTSGVFYEVTGDGYELCTGKDLSVYRGFCEVASVRVRGVDAPLRRVVQLDMMTTPMKTPEEIIEGFDYGLVRCYYDGEFKVHPTFVDTLKKGRIECPSKRTWKRVRSWRDRTGFKIVIGNPPKEREKPVGVTTLTPIAQYYRGGIRDEQRLREQLNLDRVILANLNLEDVFENPEPN